MGKRPDNSSILDLLELRVCLSVACAFRKKERRHFPGDLVTSVLSIQHVPSASVGKRLGARRHGNAVVALGPACSAVLRGWSIKKSFLSPVPWPTRVVDAAKTRVESAVETAVVQEAARGEEGFHRERVPVNIFSVEACGNIPSLQTTILANGDSCFCLQLSLTKPRMTRIHNGMACYTGNTRSH